MLALGQLIFLGTRGKQPGLFSFQRSRFKKKKKNLEENKFKDAACLICHAQPDRLADKHKHLLSF